MLLKIAETRSFQFIGLGCDEAEANQALLDRWAKHCSSYPDADPELMKEMIETEEVNTSEIEPGQAIDAGSGE
ncbi:MULTISPECIES: hypothetical protein [Pseudoalteromonas]|uniref:hypothetical protein n=1 Tax=Pseudoalteromonas TaxID=53246 RepID=UPI001583C85C|nr:MULTISPECIES: hypothetical protein [Pseudoalteromonas]MDI4654496.1 hypothetical protein [Pseudoalteromonas shioyasakiensis]NUJ39403.1 hypothetical protein [Pseudoalteromonas sp. 0303]